MTKLREVASTESHKSHNNTDSSNRTKNILKRKYDGYVSEKPLNSKLENRKSSVKFNELSTAFESEPTIRTEQAYRPACSKIGSEQHVSHVHLPLELHSPQTQTQPSVDYCTQLTHHHQPLLTTNDQGDSRADRTDLPIARPTYKRVDHASENTIATLQPLTTLRLVEGAECIPYQTAREENASAVWRTVNEVMQSTSPDLDMMDTRTKPTPLEVAIRAGQVEDVKTLLSAGASVHMESERGETPLHVAIMSRANWMICDLLLKHHADPNLRLERETPYLSIAPLTMAVHIDQRLGMAEAENQVLIVKRLLEAGAKYDPDWSESRLVHSKFLTMLSRSSGGTGTPSTPFLDCLALFLKMGSDPWSSLPDAICPAGHCHFFAQFVFFHAHEASLPDVLLQHSDIKRYGQDLVTLLLDPCPHRNKPPSGLALSFLVQKLVDRGVPFDITRNPISTALAKIPDKEKAPVIRALLSSSSLSIHTRDNHLGRPLEVLTKVHESVRWDLAEIILSRDLHLAAWINRTRMSNRERAQIFLYEPRPWYHNYTDKNYRKAVASYLSVFQWATRDDNEEIGLAVTCVIHVLTKYLIDAVGTGPLTSSDEQMLKDVMEMRQDCGLPEISVRKDSLLQSPEETKPKLEEGVSEIGDEDVKIE